MDKVTAKLYRELDAYLEAHRSEIKSEADVEALIDRFMQQQSAKPGITLTKSEQTAKTAEDYVDLADAAKSPEEALSYVKKALALDPENIDALCMNAVLEGRDDPNLALSLMSRALEQATAVMERDGWFADDNIGAFWGLAETRPYMILLRHHLECLITCGRMRAAQQEAERMLTLCENDNLGVRYILMCLYAHFEDREAMQALHHRFEDADESQMLLPLCAGFYKLGDLEGAEAYLRRLDAVNPDTREFLYRVSNETLPELPEADWTQPDTLEELTFLSLSNPYLFIGMEPWFGWACGILPPVRKPGKRGSTEKRKK